MRLVAFLENGSSALGARVRDEVINLTEHGLPGTLDALLAGGPDSMDAAARVVRRGTRRLSLEGLTYLPPLHDP